MLVLLFSDAASPGIRVCGADTDTVDLRFSCLKNRCWCDTGGAVTGDRDDSV